MRTLSYSMEDQVPWPGTELRPPALGAWSPSHWTTREVRRFSLFSPQARRSAPALHLPLYYRHSVSGTPASELPPQTAPGWTSPDPCPLMGPGAFTTGVAVMRGLGAGVLAARCVDRMCSPGHTLGWRVSASPCGQGWLPSRQTSHLKEPFTTPSYFQSQWCKGQQWFVE